MKTTITAFALAAAAASAAAETYAIDPLHSFTTFTISHLGMSMLPGRFDRMSGRIVLDRAAHSGELEVKIDTASITTGDARHEPGSWAAKNYGPRSRDEHLRSADFFNVAEFPDAVFKSSRLVFRGEALESVEGQLTLLGVTKPVKLAVTSFKCGTHPLSRKDMCGADASTQIKRSDFGMKTWLGAVGDDVRLTVSVEAYKE